MAETTWVTPTVANIDTVVAQLVRSASVTIAGDKRQAILNNVVAQVRGAIQAAGRVPLSQTAGTVPPSAELHCYVLAGNVMTANTPNLANVVVGLNGGVFSPWNDLVKDARRYIQELKEGATVEGPSLPAVWGTGPQLVLGIQAYNSQNQISVVNLVVGQQYYFSLGPNEVSIVCGSSTLTANGSFFASATTATITGNAAGNCFSGMLQQADVAANYSRSGCIHGHDDLTTPGPGTWPDNFQASWQRPACNPLVQQVVSIGFGNVVYNGATPPNGVQVGNLGDIYQQIVAGVLVQQWSKTTGQNGTNTGWT